MFTGQAPTPEPVLPPTEIPDAPPPPGADDAPAFPVLPVAMLPLPAKPPVPPTLVEPPPSGLPLQALPVMQIQTNNGVTKDFDTVRIALSLAHRMPAPCVHNSL